MGSGVVHRFDTSPDEMANIIVDNYDADITHYTLPTDAQMNKEYEKLWNDQE